MIGLSVSLCVSDVINGKVNEIDIEKIIAGTKCATNEDWEVVIAGYRKSYWYNNPDLGELVLRRLVMRGKIDQPRLRDELPPMGVHGSSNCWMHEEANIF